VGEGLAWQRGTLLLAIGAAELGRDDPQAAEEALLASAAVLEPLGAPHQLSRIWNRLGEVARKRGHYEQARRHYQSALDFRLRTGVRLNAPHRMNLAVTLLAMGEPHAALEHGEAALAEAAQTQHRAMSGHAAGVLLQCRVQLGTWEGCIELLEQASAALRAVGNLELDSAVGFGEAGRSAAAAGQTELAVGCLKLAVEQGAPYDAHREQRQADLALLHTLQVTPR
jgi:tetratricopeptide (TPR) repeat protein